MTFFASVFTIKGCSGTGMIWDGEGQPSLRGKGSNKLETWKKLDVLKTTALGRIYLKMLEELANVIVGSVYGENIFKLSFFK